MKFDAKLQLKTDTKKLFHLFFSFFREGECRISFFLSFGSISLYE